MTNAAVITTLLECPFNLIGDYVVKTAGSVDKTLAASASPGTWYRQAIVRGSATGTSVDPKALSTAFAAALNGAGSGWNVSINAAGKTTITWSGGGSESITWGATTGKILRNLLGFSSDLTFTNGQTRTSTYIAAYRMTLIARENDSEWDPVGAGVAASVQEDGVVYGEGSDRVLQTRRWTSGHHPRTPADATTQGMPHTPIFPDYTGSLTAKMTSPTEDLPTAAPSLPSTVLEFWHASKFRRLAALIGTFQTVLTAASPAVFDEIYLGPQTCERPGVRLRDARWNALMSVGPWDFTLYAQGVAIG